MDRILRRLSVLAVLLAVSASSIGLFSSGGEGPRLFVNQYGDEVTIYGRGLYRHDSSFSAPIFRGTDAVMLFLAAPATALALWLDVRKKRRGDRFFLTSLLSVILYYSASIVFGVSYNVLQLLYIALFSVSLFGFSAALLSIRSAYGADDCKGIRIRYPAVYAFLALTGAALSLAWIPDIVSSMANRRPPAIIEVYTTVATYALDMGVVAPFAIVTLVLVKKRSMMGYAFLACVLSLCVVVGIMMPVQTVFQIKAGIALPVGQMVTKSGTFIALAIAGAGLECGLFKAIRV